MPLTFTVSEFVDFLRAHLRTAVGEVTVRGEVTNYRRRSDDLVFFELKDEASVVGCFCLRWELSVELEDGQEIRVLATPSLFKKSGKFHLRVRAIELVGAGALQKAFLKLTAKLKAEGLFAPERKRALPRFPERIGLITSQDAAAYQDVLKTLKRRWLRHAVVFVPVRVQGPGAARDIARAIQIQNSTGRVDVIILTRGGGSLEDLQAFNDETVARALVASKAPVVAGIGHERDFTVAELVADLRASTPTAAAELVAPDRREVATDVIDCARRAGAALAAEVAERRSAVRDAVDRLSVALGAPQLKLQTLRQRFATALERLAARPREQRLGVDHATARLTQSLVAWLRQRTDGVERLTALLTALSPTTVLARGYSVTFDAAGKVVHDADTVRSGERIRSRLQRGQLTSEVV